VSRIGSLVVASSSTYQYAVPNARAYLSILCCTLTYSNGSVQMSTASRQCVGHAHSSVDHLHSSNAAQRCHGLPCGLLHLLLLGSVVCIRDRPFCNMSCNMK
jgi:hypothetical protein